MDVPELVKTGDSCGVILSALMFKNNCPACWIYEEGLNDFACHESRVVWHKA